jgi:hypothetical protein
VSVGLSVYPPITGRQQLSKHVPAAMKVGGVVFYAVHVISKENRRLVLPRTSCFRTAFVVAAVIVTATTVVVVVVVVVVVAVVVVVIFIIQS